MQKFETNCLWAMKSGDGLILYREAQEICQSNGVIRLRKKVRKLASSGSFSGSIRDGHYAVRVDWTQTKNVSENTSTITCRIYLVNDWSLSINSRNNNTMTIDGKAQNFTSPSIGSTGTHLLGTVSQKVMHGSDGGKAISMSVVFKIQATLSGTFYDSITANTTVTLDSIPRASSVTASNAELGRRP